jgi:hypothetical protein
MEQMQQAPEWHRHRQPSAIRLELLEQVSGRQQQAAWARIDSHLATCGRAAKGKADPGATTVTASSDAMFWQAFQDQVEDAKQYLPRRHEVASESGLGVPASPMELEEFLLAAKLVPAKSKSTACSAGSRAMPPFQAVAETPAGRQTSAVFPVVSPTGVDEAASYLLSAALHQGKRPSSRQDKAAHRQGEGASSSKRKAGQGSHDRTHVATPQTELAGGKGCRRQRRRTNQFTPQKESSSGRTSFFSPGQEAARNLLALRWGV